MVNCLAIRSHLIQTTRLLIFYLITFSLSLFIYFVAVYHAWRTIWFCLVVCLWNHFVLFIHFERAVSSLPYIPDLVFIFVFMYCLPTEMYSYASMLLFSQNNRVHAKAVLTYIEAGPQGQLAPELTAALKSLWADSGVQVCFH